MVGPVRFELTTPCTPCKCATSLRYGPDLGKGAKATDSPTRRKTFLRIFSAITSALRRPRKIRWTSPTPSLCFRVSETPGWRNWQTRWTQNPVPARECGFDPHSGHHLETRRMAGFLFPGRAGIGAYSLQPTINGIVAEFRGDFERSAPHCVSPLRKRVCKASTSY